MPAGEVTMLKLPSLFPYFQARFAALIPAVMSSVLLFMDQTITVRLVNSPAYHLKKGAGYHLVSPPSFQQTMGARGSYVCVLVCACVVGF
jgi:hypothetical protein